MMITYELPPPTGPQPEVAPDTAEYRDRAILGAQPWVDYAGNVLETWFTLQGNTTVIEVRRYNPAGQLTGQWTKVPPAGFKVDGYGVFQSGAHLLILACAHEAISDPQRRNIVYRDVIENCAAPYPAGQMPVGAVTDVATWRAIDPTPPPPAEVDYARILRDMTAQVDRLIGLFGSGSIRQALEDKAKDALVEVLTQDDERGRAFRAALSAELYRNDGLYRRVKESAYEGCVEALRQPHP